MKAYNIQEELIITRLTSQFPDYSSTIKYE